MCISFAFFDIIVFSPSTHKANKTLNQQFQTKIMLFINYRNSYTTIKLTIRDLGILLIFSFNKQRIFILLRVGFNSVYLFESVEG